MCYNVIIIAIIGAERLLFMSTILPSHPFIRFTITARDYADALRLHTRRSWATRWELKLFLLAVYALGILAMVLSGFDALLTSIAIGGMLAAPAVPAFTYFVYIPRLARRVYAQQKSMHQPVEASWTDESYTASSGTTSGTVAWTDYYGWSVDDRMVLFMQSQLLFQMVPRHGLTREQTDDLIAHVERSGLRRI